MSDKKTVIQLKNISKQYTIIHEKDAFIRYLLPKKYQIRRRSFYPLRNINLFLNQGKSLGILGRNGAGKTTLLNVIAGITSFGEGEKIIEGRISYLAALGSGFHNELNGLENIFINASILGMKKQDIIRRLKSILDFAELGDFINVPLSKYSSGMVARLAFAITVHVDFDILLIDEILSVGDLFFREKCYAKLKEFRALNKTIIMVSQSIETIKENCDRVIILDKGMIIFDGAPYETIKFYQNMKINKAIDM